MANAKKKILLAGLDNAGKTSLVEIVQNKMVDTVTIQPTKGISRKEAQILGESISVHDMGGQAMYRRQYLQRPIIYGETDAVVFVIDLQDRARYDEAVGYFDSTLVILSQLNPLPKVFILLSKYDGDYFTEFQQKDTPLRTELDELLVKLQQAAVEHDMSIIDAFRTSIFNEWSVYAAFFEIWSSIVTRLNDIQAYLEHVIADIPDTQIAILLDGSGNLLAYQLTESASVPLDALVEIAGKTITFMLEWKKNKINRVAKEQDFVSLKIEGQSVLIQKLEADKDDYYLVMLIKSVQLKSAQDILQKLGFSLSIFLSIQEK
jgi:GTPase SAR1 family protein